MAPLWDLLAWRWRGQSFELDAELDQSEDAVPVLVDGLSEPQDPRPTSPGEPGASSPGPNRPEGFGIMVCAGLSSGIK
jgi:hypothetical protein